jgi:CheY-like chemotaxis protein
MTSSAPFEVSGYSTGAIPAFRRMLGEVLHVTGDRLGFTEASPSRSSVQLDGKKLVLSPSQLDALTMLVKESFSELQAFDGSTVTVPLHAPASGARLSEPTFGMPVSAMTDAATYAGPEAPVVIIAEDDDDLRALLIKTLGQRYTVFAVSDGVLALDLLLKIPKPAAMLLDINMPRVDGLTVATRLKEHPWLRSIPILFLTARGSPEEEREGFETGARCYLTKPFRSQDLMAKLAEIIAPTVILSDHR